MSLLFPGINIAEVECGQGASINNITGAVSVVLVLTPTNLSAEPPKYNNPLWLGTNVGDVCIGVQVEPGGSLTLFLRDDPRFPTTVGYSFPAVSLIQDVVNTLIFTWDGSTDIPDNVKCYLAGVLAGTASKTDGLAPLTDCYQYDPTASLRLGSLGTPTFYNTLAGPLEFSAIYARELSGGAEGEAVNYDPAAVAALTPEAKVAQNIRALYLFDEGAGTIAHDTSGNANDGAITGATWEGGAPPAMVELGNTTRIVGGGILPFTVPPIEGDKVYISENAIDAEPLTAPYATLLGGETEIQIDSAVPVFVEVFRGGVRALRNQDRALPRPGASILADQHICPLQNSITLVESESFIIGYDGGPFHNLQPVPHIVDNRNVSVVNGKLRIDAGRSFEGQYSGIPIRTYEYLNPSELASWAYTVKFDIGSAMWTALYAYYSEAGYFAVFVDINGTPMLRANPNGPDAAFTGATAAPNLHDGREYRIAVAKATATSLTASLYAVNTPAETWSAAIEGVVDDGFPVGFWFAADCSFGNGAVEFSPIEVTGKRVPAGFTDNGLLQWELFNASVEVGSENDVGIFASCGGVTAINSRGDLMPHPGFSSNNEGYAQSFNAGEGYATSPSFILPAGKKFDTLYLVGSLRQGGLLKYYFLDAAGNLLSEDLFPGNAAGFTPLEGNITSHDVSNLPDGAKVKLWYSNPTEGATAPPVWQAMWFGDLAINTDTHNFTLAELEEYMTPRIISALEAQFGPGPWGGFMTLIQFLAAFRAEYRQPYTPGENANAVWDSGAPGYDFEGSMGDLLHDIRDAVASQANIAEAVYMLISPRLQTLSDLVTKEINAGVLASKPITTGPIKLYRGKYRKLTFNLGAAWDLTGKKTYLTAKKVPMGEDALFDLACTITGARTCTVEITPDVVPEIMQNITYQLTVMDMDGSSPEVAADGQINILQDVRQ